MDSNELQNQFKSLIEGLVRGSRDKNIDEISIQLSGLVFLYYKTLPTVYNDYERQVAEVTTWLNWLYDNYIASIDLSFIPNLIEGPVDAGLKHLIVPFFVHLLLIPNEEV